MKSHNSRSPNVLNMDLEFDQRTNKKQVVQWSGVTLEHANITAASGYEFSWQGERHYLAIHDMLLIDGEMTVADSGTVRGGDLRNKLTYLPANCSIKGWSENVQRQNSYTALYFDLSVLSDELERPIAGPGGPSRVYFEHSGIKSTLAKLESLMKADFDGGLHAETLALLAILELGAFEHADLLVTERHSRLSAAQEMKIRDFIEANIARNFSLSDLAAIAGQSRFHFSRVFKQTFGQSPHRFVTTRRVDVAKSLLANSDKTISEIANAVGYNGVGQFIRAFREIETITPHAYRRLI